MENCIRLYEIQRGGEIVATVSIVGECCRKGFFGGPGKRAQKKFFIISLQSTHAWYKIGIKVVESGAKWKKVVSADPFLEILVVTLAVPRYTDISVADHLQGGKWMDDGGRLRQTLRAGD